MGHLPKINELLNSPNNVFGACADFMNNYIHTSLVVIAIPLLAILVPALLTWARDLTGPAPRIRRLEEESKVIAFWEDWWRVESTVPINGAFCDYHAERSISAVKMAVRRELANSAKRALALYKDDEVRNFNRYPLTFAEFQKYRAGLSQFRRVLLIYKSPNPTAKFYKIAFQGCVAELFLAPLPMWWLIGKSAWLSPKYTDAFMKNHQTLSILLLVLLLSVLLMIVAVRSIIKILVSTRSKSIQFENDPIYYVRDSVFSRYTSEKVEGN